MNVIMSGLDYSLAPISLREKLSFNGSRAGEASAQICAEQEEILGCAILSTCNRTEIYLSCRDGVDMNPAAYLCAAAGQDYSEFSYAFVTRRGAETCVEHLARVAAGLKSQIWGEDQIVTQVKNAIGHSREAHAADGVLETVFRTAVSAAKEIKTSVTLTDTSASAARRAVEELSAALGGLDGKKVMVIGNGVMGRLSASLLVSAGAKVLVTLRTYKRGETIVPSGCDVVHYDARYPAMAGLDAVVSATTSPHYTVTAEELAAVPDAPRLLADLAIPRDIDPAIGEQEGVTLHNIDTLGERVRREVPALAEEILEKHLGRFRRWADYRRRISAAEQKDAPRFPLFIDLCGRKCVVVGGGAVACRRAGVLHTFGADVTVIAPRWKGGEHLVNWLPRCYEKGDLEGALLVVAATNDREVNRQVGEDAKALGIPVSVCDRLEECTFFFPAVCLGDGLVAGVVSDGIGHRRTAEAAKAIRRTMEALS